MERAQEVRSKEIERTQRRVMDKDREVHLLRDRVNRLKLEFGVVSKSFLNKVGQSEEEFDQLKRQQSDLHFELSRITERVRTIKY